MDKTYYHQQFGLPDNGRDIIGLVICNSWGFSAFGYYVVMNLPYYKTTQEMGFVVSSLYYIVVNLTSSLVNAIINEKEREYVY